MPPRWNSRKRDYPVEDLIFDLANLRAGHRFTPEGDNPRGGRLGGVCARVYGRADHPGYLEMGVPPDYGDGAAEAVRDMTGHPGNRHRLLNDLLRPGDLERVLTEWRSLLLHVAAAPGLSVGSLAGVPGGGEAARGGGRGGRAAGVSAVERGAAAAVSAPAVFERMKDEG